MTKCYQYFFFKMVAGLSPVTWKVPLNQTWNWHWLTNRTTCMSSKTHTDKPDWSELRGSLQLLVFWKWDMMAAVSHANTSQDNVHRENIVDTLKPRQNGHHFADDSFNWIFFNENALISIKIPLKCFPDGPINHIPALVHTLAWRRSSYKPLSEPMMVRLPTHICVTRSQWVKDNSLII